ncbi:MAG TPA: hypothetical protein VK087_08680 [Tissierellaceae bacterium]|nr:hypothetical protein [Tissierellaceae bacterium]
MGILKGKNSKFLIYFITGLVWGILIGTLILVALVSYRMDEYYKKIVYLENVIIDKEAKLEKVEDTINTQYVVLEDIDINLDFIGDELDKIEIEKAIKEKYNSLLGKEVKDMDADILLEVIDRRIFKVGEKEYKLKVEKLILTETLELYIEVEQVVEMAEKISAIFVI